MRIDRVKILGLMRDRGIANLGDLAELVGVTPQTFSRWFAGTWGPSFDNLESLCRVLDCTVDDLVVYDRPKDPALAPA